MDPSIWLIVVIGIIIAFILYLILHHKHKEPVSKATIKVPMARPVKKVVAKKAVKKKK